MNVGLWILLCRSALLGTKAPTLEVTSTVFDTSLRPKDRPIVLRLYDHTALYGIQEQDAVHQQHVHSCGRVQTY